jgi:hypothetical protein
VSLFNIFTKHPMMRLRDRITVIGYNGDRCCISGEGMGEWGPILAPGSTGLFEAPARTNWGPGMLGQRFESWSPQPRNPVFTIHVVNPQTGEPLLDTDPYHWHDVYSRWRAMWSMEFESTVVYESVDDERHLGLRLLQEPKPFATQPFEGRDPHLYKYGSIVMPTGCENPYYVGPTKSYAYEYDGNDTDHWFRIPFFNPCDVDIWPHWRCTDRASYMFPDYSWGSEEWGRGVQDEGRTIRVPHVGSLLIGENLDIETRQDEETIRAENDAPVGNRMGGNDFRYPIRSGFGAPPGLESELDWAVVMMRDITNPAGSRVELSLPQWNSSPFGTPKVA